MLSNDAGTVEIITFRATRSEHPYLESLMALIRGTSTGHIALRLTFHNSDLFKQYIANSDIPHRIINDKISGKTLYEVYVSFWPAGDWAPWHPTSSLRRYRFDCEQSGTYSPFKYDPEIVARLKLAPIEKFARSNLPFFNYFDHTTINLPPSIILHTTRLKTAYGSNGTVIAAAAESFATKYHEWRTALVKEQNAKLINEDAPELLKILKRDVHIAQMRMQISRRELKSLMFPNIEMDDQTFDEKLEPFVTFGFPERDNVVLPVVYNGNKTSGFELQPMLKFINDIASNPGKHPYNVLSNNCAKVIFEILWSGVKNSRFKQLSQQFMLSWLSRWFKLTVTPALLLGLAIKTQEVLTKLRDKQERQLEQTHNMQHREVAANNRTAQSKHLVHVADEENGLLQFSNQDTTQEELPTTSVAIAAKLLNNACSYLR
jgi:hypothetical protein